MIGILYRIRDALYDGAITGDYCAHFFWVPYAEPYGGTLSANRGEIRMELVDGVNVLFGNLLHRQGDGVHKGVPGCNGCAAGQRNT